MSLIKKYPLPVYDPPASYREFSGGINTSLSNESLQPNELRDALNCHYENDTLVNRPGASRLAILTGLPKDRPQGDFLFNTENVSWIISVRNGRIYYGDFESQSEINMTLLHTKIERTESVLDTENYLVNLQTLEEGEVNWEEAFKQNHQGFIFKYPRHIGEGNESETGESGEIEYEETLVIQNTKRVQGIPVDDYFILATGTRILKITEIIGDNGNYYLTSEILKATKPNSWEYNKIGPNYLSPFPQYHISEVEGVPMTEIGFIMPDPWYLTIEDMDRPWNFNTVISTQLGYDKSDFYYKWEVKYADFTDNTYKKQVASTPWVTIWSWDAELNKERYGLTEDKDATSLGKSSISLTPNEFIEAIGSEIIQDGKFIYPNPAILVRCTLTSKFQTTYDLDEKKHYAVRDDYGDLVAEQASAIYSRTHQTYPLLETSLSEEASIHNVDQYFYYIHSCTKVTADGQKALFYDDAYNTGSWFKTVISQYDYITKNMSLNFKTTKNESLVAVAVFDTNIVVFADNEQLGGNISVVTGNGDDYNKDDYYSPYQRKVVNTSVSCDSYNSMQQVDNYVVFKYRQDIYTLDSTALSNLDTVTVETINDSVKNRLGSVEFPLDRIRTPRKKEDIDWDFHNVSKCLKPDEIFSEVYDGCYSIIFPRQGTFKDTISIPQENLIIPYKGPTDKYKNTYIENVTIKPGLRWKCYIRNARMYQNTSKPSYPWLRDVSYLFDVVGIVHVEGQPCYIRENGDVIRFDRINAISYTSESDEAFKLRITTKAYDMEAPALCKFLDSCTLYYSRDFTNNHMMSIKIHNEADYELYGPDNEAFISVKELTDQVQFNDNISFDEILNLTEKEKPASQYEKTPFVDSMDKPVQILSNSVPLNTATLNRPNFASKTCTPKWRFPFLSCAVTIEMEGNQAFTLSALNFSYTASDMPDFTREQLYRNIIRR